MSLKLQTFPATNAKWVGFGKNRLAVLTRMRLKALSQGKKRVFKKTYALPDGVRVQVVAAATQDTIRIWGGGVSGFICHPRSNEYPGGLTPGDVPITPAYIYPLIDNDHGSIVLTPNKENPPIWAIDSSVENYGNIDWLEDATNIVTWRGPPGRILPMDSTIAYPGFTFFDYESTDLIPIEHYTPYQHLVYAKGERHRVFPEGTKVLGATLDLTVLGRDYTGITNPDDGIGGFYIEVWAGNTFRIGFIRDSRPTMPWFFNQEGTRAVSGNKQLNIAWTEKEGSVISEALPEGEGVEEKAMAIGTNWHLSRSGEFFSHYDYALTDLRNISLLISEVDTTTRVGNGANQYSSIDIYYCGVQPTSILITGPDAYLGPSYYSAAIVPSGAGICDGEPVWAYPTGCGMGTITATWGVVNGTKQVRMPTGIWSNQIISGTAFTGDCTCSGLYYCKCSTTYTSWVYTGPGTRISVPGVCHGVAYFIAGQLLVPAEIRALLTPSCGACDPDALVWICDEYYEETWVCP